MTRFLLLTGLLCTLVSSANAQGERDFVCTHDLRPANGDFEKVSFQLSKGGYNVTVVTLESGSGQPGHKPAHVDFTLENLQCFLSSTDAQVFACSKMNGDVGFGASSKRVVVKSVGVNGDQIKSNLEITVSPAFGNHLEFSFSPEECVGL